MNRRLYTVVALVGVSLLSGKVKGAIIQDHDQATVTPTLLNTAAKAHVTEIALGKLATERASSSHVKEFAAKITAEHQHAKEDVQQLATIEGIPLAMAISEYHLETMHRLTDLSGQHFDTAYLATVLEDHDAQIQALNREARDLSTPEAAKWAADHLPLLRAHVEEARRLASSLGMPLEPSQ